MQRNLACGHTNAQAQSSELASGHSFAHEAQSVTAVTSSPASPDVGFVLGVHSSAVESTLSTSRRFMIHRKLVSVLVPPGCSSRTETMPGNPLKQLEKIEQKMAEISRREGLSNCICKDRMVVARTKTFEAEMNKTCPVHGFRPPRIEEIRIPVRISRRSPLRTPFLSNTVIRVYHAKKQS